jgi:uncharacterized protein
MERPQKLQESTMRKCVTVLAAIAVATISTAAARAAPSFNCHAAQFPDEFAICQSPVLSEMDSKLADFFQGVLYAMPARIGGLRGSELRWLDYRHSCGYDMQCIGKAYQARIFELSEIARHDRRCRHQPDLIAPAWCGASQAQISDEEIEHLAASPKPTITDAPSWLTAKPKTHRHR